MKCAFPKCKKQANGSKQFNDLVIRIYLCTEHLIKVAEMDSYSKGKEFIEMLKNG